MKKYELIKQWEKEQKRIKRLVKKLAKENAGIDFNFPIIRPKKITEASVRKLKKVKELDITKRIKKEQELNTPKKQKPTTIETNKEIRVANPKPYVNHPRIKKVEEKREPLSKEERSRIAKEAVAKITPEKRKEMARKAAETKRKKREADPDYAQKQREASLKNLEKAREAKRNKQAEQIDTTDVKKEEQKETEQYVKEQQKTDEKRDETVSGIDPITGEVLTTNDIEDRKKSLRKDDKKEYQKLLELRKQKREEISDEPYNATENIIDTIREELNHAVNEDIADFIEGLLDDAISYHEMMNDYQEWLANMNLNKGDILSHIYRVIDESDGEKVRESAVGFLIAIYGSYGNIPESALETVEQLTSEYYFGGFSPMQKRQRRILRSRKIRERYGS